MSSDKKRSDIHQTVTDRIIAMLETAQKAGGEMPWHRPGVAHSRPTNVLSQKRYRGINVLSLWGAADAANYRSGIWGTYAHWSQIGAQVRKGERASPIVFYKPLEIADEKAGVNGDGGEPGTKTVRMAKGYWGFNADQVDGYPLPEMPTDDKVQPIAGTEAFIAALGIPIKHGGARAFYRPSEDFIQMPDKILFRDMPTSTATDGYHAVLFHECGHASGAKHRLDRDLSGRFGSNSYAMEEMVAEFCSGLLCADLGISAQPREDHAHYIANWLAVLKNDKAAVFAAAAAANRAVEFLHNLQSPTVETTEVCQ